MRFPKWTWLAIAALLALGARWAFWYYDKHCDCHCLGQKEYSERWGFTCKVIGEPASAIALLGIVGVVVGFMLISGQMSQTDESIQLSRKANKAAKKSAKAAKRANKETVKSNKIAAKALEITRQHEEDAIDRERGTMAFWKLAYNPATFSFDYCFINMGGGPLIINEITSGCAILKQGQSAIKKITGYRGFIYIPVPVDGFASTFDDGPIMEMIAGDGVAIPNADRGFVGMPGYEAVICIRMKYQARTKGVFISQALVRVSNFSKDDWYVDLGHPFTFETPEAGPFDDLFLSIEAIQP